MDPRRTRICYTLRRKSDGAWLDGDHVTKDPKLITRLDTALRQRIRSITTENNLIEVCKVSVDVKVVETLFNEEVFKRLATLINAFEASSVFGDSRTENFRMRNEVIFLCAESLMKKKDGLNMRYFACLLKEDEHDDEFDKLEIMKELARYMHENGIYLIKSDSDLAVMKLVKGFEPNFIFDFEESRVIYP